MARMNISVSEEMRAEITRFGDKVNWSGLAQEAFAREIAKRARPKEYTMEDAIERLRESKKRHQAKVSDQGKEAGRKWAETQAEWPELKRVAAIDAPEYNGDWAVAALTAALDPEKTLDWSEFAETLGIDPFQMNQELAEAFIEGASEFYEEVADKI